MKQSIYQQITNYFIDSLKKGQIPWTAAFEKGTCNFISHQNGIEYTFLNKMLIQISGGKPGEYATFLQIKNENGKVKKGAFAKDLVFAKKEYYTEELEVINPKTKEKEIQTFTSFKYIAKTYKVFNILTDTENIQPKYYEETKTHKYKPIKYIDDTFNLYYKKYNIRFQHDNVTPNFTAFTNTITIPELKYAVSKERYYKTLCHETIHSTGPILNRDLSGKFGSKQYATEELVAEIGAAFLLAEIGINYKKTIENSVAYINNWITRLQNDPKLIIVAAAQAEKAINLILNKNEQSN